MKKPIEEPPTEIGMAELQNNTFPITKRAHDGERINVTRHGENWVKIRPWPKKEEGE